MKKIALLISPMFFTACLHHGPSVITDTLSKAKKQSKPIIAKMHSELEHTNTITIPDDIYEYSGVEFHDNNTEPYFTVRRGAAWRGWGGSCLYHSRKRKWACSKPKYTDYKNFKPEPLKSS